MSGACRSISSAAMTNTVRWDCTCCGKADSRPSELPVRTNQRTQSIASGIGFVFLSSLVRYRDRSPSGVHRDVEHGLESTSIVGSRPRSRWSHVGQSTRSKHRLPKSRFPAGPTSPWRAGRDPSPAARCLRSQSGFFPPIEYSPSLTFVLVSTDISSVSGSSFDSA